MKPRKQVKVSPQKRGHFDRQLVQTGGTRYLAVTKIIPQDWLHVRIEVKRKDQHALTVRITKLYGEGNNTPAKENNKKRKQNT